MNGVPWTDVEMQRLRKLYPTTDWRELRILCSPRTCAAIRLKAAELGLRKPKPPKRPPPAFKRRNWRQICNDHKPHIILAQPFPAERP